MARDPLSGRCTFLLSETVTVHEVRLRQPCATAGVHAILAGHDTAVRHIERVEALERSDRLDRWRQELAKDHEPS